MEVLKISVFVLLSIAITNANQVAEWKKHTSRVTKFSCNHPQPRSITLSELPESSEKDVLNTARHVLPQSTVLHRCESAGCCPPNKTCSPAEIKDVKLVFVVLAESGRHNKHYVEINAKNHTRCVCDVFKDSPK